jgi:hypothetical protein
MKKILILLALVTGIATTATMQASAECQHYTYTDGNGHVIDGYTCDTGQGAWFDNYYPWGFSWDGYGTFYYPYGEQRPWEVYCGDHVCI